MWSSFARRGWRAATLNRKAATSFRGFRGQKSEQTKTHLDNAKTLAPDYVAHVFLSSPFRCRYAHQSYSGNFSWIRFGIGAVATGIAVTASSIIFADTAHADDLKKDQEILAIMKNALEKGKLQEAASLLWDLIGSDRVDKRQPNITELLSRGRIDEAIAHLKKQISTDPHNPMLHKNMAMAMILKEKFEEALFWLDEALWADPKGDAEIFFHRGNILQKLEQHQEALTCYEKAIVFVPLRIRFTTERFQAQFLVSRSLNPTFHDALDARVEVVRKLNIPLEDKIIDYCRGAALYDLGLYDEALRSFQAAVLKDPSFKEAHYNINVVSYMADQAARLRTGKATSIPGNLLHNMTTHFEYAAMSEAAYSDSRAAVPRGWQVLTTSNDIGDRDGPYSRDGFYAVAYVNHRKREVVVAHKGSHNKEDIITDINLFINQVDRQFLCAKKFAEQVAKNVKTDPALHDYALTFTGHSLGGAEAEYVAYKLRSKAVTFESPGSLEIIQTLERNPSIDPRSVDAICFLSRPNLINTAKSHVGTVLRIYPPLPAHLFKAENALLVEKVIEGVKKLLSFLFIPGFERLEARIANDILQLAAETEVLLLETAHWHSMPRIAQAFRHQYETGIPIQCREVVKWPTTKSFYLFYRVSRDTVSGEPERSELGDLNQEVLDYAQYLVAPRNNAAIPLSDFDSSERRFLFEFLHYKHKVEPYLTEQEKRVLSNYRIEYNKVVLTALVSRDEWRTFVKRLFRRLTEAEPATFGYWYS